MALTRRQLEGQSGASMRVSSSPPSFHSTPRTEGLTEPRSSPPPTLRQTLIETLVGNDDSLKHDSHRRKTGQLGKARQDKWKLADGRQQPDPFAIRVDREEVLVGGCELASFDGVPLPKSLIFVMCPSPPRRHITLALVAP
ncbi:hypothetical protein E2C01_034043 [Portunus trituberculatus]|uniref:Uncharacterized protein n=1 Tax=Portunus trituberculatus TaxID=210409 RepID=A0A5B7F5W1_PORTR|nr:hypothetical protein [Portunus trituberculatus]